MRASTLEGIISRVLGEYEIKRAGRVPLSYNVTVEARHSDGELFATRQVANTITDAGEDEVAKLLCGVAANAFTWVAMGTDNTAAVDSQTALEAEISSNGGTRAQDASPETSANVATISYLFTISGALGIMEAGLFNAASVGDMLARQVFAVINVGAGDTVTISWAITSGVAR